MNKAARCGEPSYVWRAGQERRLQMVLEAGAGLLQDGAALENGCGVGMYVEQLASRTREVVGMEYDYERAEQAARVNKAYSNVKLLNAAGERLPFPNGAFDLILSHEVLEHVQDDRAAVEEMVRVLRLGGRIVLFVPNRGYPFETHGIYWKGKYYFGNKPLVNYLPRRLRDRLAPHVRVYTRGELGKLFSRLPVRIVQRRIIFGAYDNIITRRPALGKVLRSVMQWFEKTPLSIFGLSHFWVVEKIKSDSVS